MINRTALVGPLLAVALACNGDRAGAGEWLGSVTDSAGISVVSNPAEGQWLEDEAWKATEALSIGMLEGPAEYTFFQLAAVIVDSQGTIYALDRGDKLVKIYSPSGSHVRSFGGQGEGPGEFQEPSLMIFLDTTLVVHDWRQRRLTYFTRSGSVVRTVRTEMGITFTNGLAAVGDSTLLLGQSFGYSMPPRPEVEGRMWVFRLTLDGEVLDTLVTARSSDMIPYRTETFLMVITAPFPRASYWAVAPDGRIAFGRSDAYDISLYEYPSETRGETGAVLHARMVAKVRRVAPPLPATDPDVEAYREHWLGREGLPPDRRRRYEEMLGSATYPSTWPAFQDLEFDTEGRLWVKQSSHYADSTAAWDVMDVDGRYLGAVDLPKDLRVHAITDDAIYGVMRDELDVQYVKQYRIER